MNMENLLDDIPADLARAAHRGTSFVPEQRAVQERASYAATLSGDFARLSKLATTDEKRATLVEEWPRYREGYRKRYVAMLEAKSRCMSTMVAGPANFPTRRNQKRSDATERRVQDLLEYRTRALAAIHRALHPELAPVMLGDSDAADRLREKIESLEKLREQMKACNATIRRHAKQGLEAQVAALVALGFFGEARARELLKPDFCGRIGFADYEIKNSGAELRRLQGRLALVERNQAEAATEYVGENARMEDCPAENRVRIFFPGKPAADVRSALKARAFRFAPSLGCWQAYRNTTSIAHARSVCGKEAT